MPKFAQTPKVGSNRPMDETDAFERTKFHFPIMRMKAMLLRSDG